MENIFRPNKWFVMFCGLLIVVWGGYQLVANMRIADEAKAAGHDVFSWDWPDMGWSSRAEITDATVVRRSDTDAIVKIKGEQHVTSARLNANGQLEKERPQVVDLSATLTFYRSSNNWVLGRVELP